MFNCLASMLKTKLVHALLTSDNDTHNIKAAVATLLRKLPLEGELVAKELSKMVEEIVPKTAQAKRTTRY
jgi:hypothetical protein